MIVRPMVRCLHDSAIATVKTVKEGWVEEDSTLAARVSNGDADAEEALVVRFRGRVLALARARGCDTETAADIAQETLLSVLCALRGRKLRDNNLLPRFVAGTARNLVNNHFRARHGSLRPADKPAPPEWDASRWLIAAEDAALVRRALEQVPPDDRRLLGLIFDRELCTSAIAEELGTTTEAVRQRKHRAIERLRRAIEELSHPALQRHNESDGLR
jgi:RNA polymerase sigma-70 factor (ECF subfamily)